MSHLENWRKSSTARAEFAAILQEPVMQAAIEVVKEVIFTPLRPPQGMPPTERQAWFGEMGLRREAYLEMLRNFLGLAEISQLKEKGKDSQKKKPWETDHSEEAKAKLLEETVGSPQSQTGATGPTGATLETPYPPPEQPRS